MSSMMRKRVGNPMTIGTFPLPKRVGNADEAHDK
jgi:hypothetical protein